MYGTHCNGMVWYVMVWYGMMWCGKVWCGMVWYMIWYSNGLMLCYVK
jgi:hypothetical protein